MERGVSYMMDRFLPEEIRVARIELGISLREAAKRTGVTKETLSDIERGIRMPHPSTIKKIADGYGVPTSRFLKSRQEVLSSLGFREPSPPEPGPKAQAPSPEGSGEERRLTETAEGARLDEERSTRDTAGIGRERRTVIVEPLPEETPQRHPERRLTLDDVAHGLRNINRQITQYLGRDDVSIKRAEEEAKLAEGAWLLAQELGRKLAPGDTVAEVDHPELQSAMDALLRDADRLVKDAQSRADEDARRREQGGPRELPDDAADGIA
jgi:transcriptional regulator with XRE-family HTH domain